ncbi:Protein of unknown function (DUF330) [Methylophaga frappieri]|uniref:ABC-type transport auxiliary lipoprotein component domain-containing protein n=2 Tax=Methylophaga frappieri (strain ATCC BAA-2434 / DSM 25690 / JAM7) TaxID=754477 RepID=I1YEH1_METFJ|nr:Protein of unknown function (DUF330) [Methylophaga frappieri]
MALLAGCFSFGGGEDLDVDDNQPRLYIVEADRGSVASDFAVERTLLIKPVRVAPYFRETDIMMRVGENQYESRPPHELLTSPQTMFTAQLERWLAKSGLFSKVITDASEPHDLVLETGLTKLFGEARPAYPPQAVLEMQFFLSPAGSESEDRMLLQTGFRVDADINQSRPSEVIIGWKNGLEEILATLELDLKAYFAKPGSP